MRLKKLSLPLGLLCGIVAAVMVYAFLQEQERRIAGPPPPKVSVVVARADVPSGARLTPDMLAVQPVLAETRHPLALQSLAEVDGKLTLSPLVRGEQVLASRLGDKPRANTLAGVVPAGRRAVSVAATDVVGVGGLIQPGDRVDVLAVFDKGGDKSTAVAVLSLEDIEVLAVDKEVNGLEKDSSLPAATDVKKTAATAGPGVARTVTLAVTPEEAQKLMLADRSGTLRLGLRAKGDTGNSTIVETDARTMAKSQ